MRLTERELMVGLRELGFGPADLQACLQGAKTLEEANTRIEALKGAIRKSFRKAAFDLHPDRGGDEEAFKRLNAIMQAVEAMEAYRQPPRPTPRPHPQVRVTVVTHHYGGGTGTTTSTGGWGEWSGAW